MNTRVLRDCNQRYALTLSSYMVWVLYHDSMQIYCP